PRLRALSYAIACPKRAGGIAAHPDAQALLQVAPFQSHVSAKGALVPCPPKSTATPLTRSKAIAWPDLAAGALAMHALAVHACVQLLPFHCHVSPKIVAPDSPPKRTAVWRALS